LYENNLDTAAGGADSQAQGGRRFAFAVAVIQMNKPFVHGSLLLEIAVDNSGVAICDRTILATAAVILVLLG
jgi:hypothetical protein